MLKVNFESNETKMNLEVENPSSKHITLAVEGFFKYLNSRPHAVLELTEAKECDPSLLKESVAPIKFPITIPGEGEMTKSSSDSEDDKNYFTTGYKIRNGEKRYKCYYRCPKCNGKGQHYIPEDTHTVNCHTCNTVMMVQKAVPDSEEFKKDMYNNWYVAGNQRPIGKFITPVNSTEDDINTPSKLNSMATALAANGQILVPQQNN